MISLSQFRRSIKHALEGIVQIADEEQSFRIQFFAGAGVLGLMFAMPSLQIWERVALIFLIAMVLILEIINSIVERLADALEPKVSPMVKDIKDMMAGAVLLSAIASAVIGTLIFWPHIHPTLSILWKMVVL